MAFFTTASLIRGENLVLIRTVIFVFILIITVTNMTIAAPINNITKSYEGKTLPIVVSTEKNTFTPGSQIPNFNTSITFKSQNDNKTQNSISKLKHAHDVRYLQNFPFMIPTTRQGNIETPATTMTAETSMLIARPSNVVLKDESNQHVSTKLRNSYNFVKSINSPRVNTDTRTTHSLPENILETMIYPDEPIVIQKPLIQLTTITPKKENNLLETILLSPSKQLSTQTTSLPNSKGLSEVNLKQKNFDQQNVISTEYDVNESITESVVIGSLSEVKNILNFNSQQNSATLNSTINNTTEARDEQKKHPNFSIKIKDMERQDLKSIKKVNEHPHNAGNDDIKTTINKKLFDNHVVSIIKTAFEANKNNKNKSEENVIYRKSAWQPHLKPTLKPIQNGFLGPIHMEEKTFSVIRRGKEPFHHQSHIRNEKFVEIIAPKVQPEHTANTEVDTATVSSTLNIQHEMKSAAVLSTTVFQVPDLQTSTTHFPRRTQFQSNSLGKQSLETTPQLFENNQQTESKISDIQIEVYDSTVDSIISSTNFKESEGYFLSSFETAVAATKPPMLSSDQDKFTQYVIDNIDSSTEKSYMTKIPYTAGVPEPAAIEIHINVSEGRGNESEDLEFSYRQPEYLAQSKSGQGVNASFINKTLSDIPSKLNNSGSMISEQSDEILVVEIIDTSDNSTENSASFENININPILTFCSDTVKHVVSKNSNQKSVVSNLKSHPTDDLFMPDVRKDDIKNKLLLTSPTRSPMPQNLVPDRDSDTIFYISNTEVKVGESLPTANTNTEQQLKKTRLENQFFPVNYVSSTHPNADKLEEQHRYEEDIILSPIHNSANLVKIFRSQGESSPPLDVTYVGESVMEVEQSSGVGTMIYSSSYSPLGSQKPDVIIHPAILPEISIGVPIIGELPPQIELKEIDYMPVEESENDSHNNEVERIMESSIQYGGDLIDEGGVIGGGGFDGIEGSYPFENPALVKSHLRPVGDFPNISVNNRISNLKKDVLIADVSGSGELFLGSLLENGTIRDLLKRNGSDLLVNGTIDDMVHSENETVFYHPSPVEDADTCLSDVKTLFLAWFSTLFPLVATIFLVFGLRYLYRRYRADGKNGEDLDTEEPTEWPSQTDHLPTLTSTDVIVETNSKSRNNSRDNLVILSNTNSVSNECCTLENYTAFAANDINSKASPNQTSSVHSSYIGPNGSVTTMTLKNNHLIVETEERNDISRDTRETKMHYSTTEKDGIFVVEVSRGIDSKSMPDSPVTRTNQSFLALETLQNCSTVVSGNDVKSVANIHEEVQIHQPPQENHILAATGELQMALHQIEEVDESIHSPNSTIKQTDVVDFNYGRISNTGLSQSDLSSTSSTDSNKRYSYGNQELYTSEKPVYFPLLPAIQSPLQTVAGDVDDDHQSENGQSTIQTPTKLQTIPTQNNNTQGSQKPTNHDNQLTVTSSREQCQDSTSVEIIFNDNLRPQLNGNNDEYSSIMPESYMENLESNYNGYDSLISLPDPPSIEEIKQLNDCSFIESNQLDSLPPPPPPPLSMVDSNGHEFSQEKTMPHEGLYVRSLKISHENGLKISVDAPSEFSTKNSISSTPLTPPASPPHYTNGGKGILTPIALAVNVNGS